jgi:hypothetical protein
MNSVLRMSIYSIIRSWAYVFVYLMLQIEELLKDTMRNMALNVTGSQKLIRLARHRNSHGIARLCIWILYSRTSHYNNTKYERKNLLCNLKWKDLLGILEYLILTHELYIIHRRIL